MIFTRIAWVAGLLLLATMCWLAIQGLSTVVPLLVTGFVLVLLIGGGNFINGRSSPSGNGGRPPGGHGDPGPGS